MSDMPLNLESMTRAFGDCAIRSPTRSLAYIATPVALRVLTKSLRFIVISRRVSRPATTLYSRRNRRHREVFEAHGRHERGAGVVVRLTRMHRDRRSESGDVVE